MNRIRKTIQILALAFLISIVTLAASCNANEATGAKAKAIAIINDTSNTSQVLGEVSLNESESGLLIKAEIKQAPPGKHGFHIHELGSCDDGGKGAGGHFNPDKVKHGDLLKDGFENAHAGDLGNINIAEDGTGFYNQTIPGLTLKEGKYIVGNRAFILHAKEDDFGQPTGNAGARIGCGMIASIDG
ncbi:MAG: superoxide dismutase family protein [Moorea sp. SIO2B7]|nr:superoxide dismutase family protein [Moorena sp. SIO2B7]